MRLNKIKVSKDLTLKLRVLKSRTQLTPNILCRIGLMLSLESPPLATAQLPPMPEDGNEFNRYTLLGQWDPLITAMIREAHERDGLCDDVEAAFRFHLFRGVQLLYPRVKSLSDVLRLSANLAVEQRQELAAAK